MPSLNFWQEILPPSAFAFAAILVLTYLTVKLAPKMGLMDSPDRDHPAILHQKPVARGGGLPLFLGFLLTVLIFLPWEAKIAALLLGSSINVIVGAIDDRRSLSPWLRLLVTLPCSAVPLVLSGVHFFTSNPLGDGSISFQWLAVKIPWGQFTLYLPEALILIFWIVWVCNMVNWTKGASQLPGLTAIAFAVLGGVALKYQAGDPAQLMTAKLSFVLCAGSLAFLPFNFPPEKIFPGFGGSTFLGLNLAALAILSGGKVAAALLVLGIPTADMLLTFAHRLRQGRNPLYGDRGHLYHLLLDTGLTKRQVILLYWGLTALLGLMALQMQSGGKLFMLALVFVVTAGFLATTRWLISRRRSPTL